MKYRNLIFQQKGSVKYILNRIESGVKTRYQNIFEFEINFPLYDYGVGKQTMQIMDHNTPKHYKQCNSFGSVDKYEKLEIF